MTTDTWDELDLGFNDATLAAFREFTDQYAMAVENSELKAKLDKMKIAVDETLDCANAWKEEWKDAANEADYFQRQNETLKMKNEAQESYIAYLEGRLAARG